MSRRSSCKDDDWTLVIQDLHSDLGRDDVERIANSLTPFPLAGSVAAPTLPQAWCGPVADVLGHEGKAVVTGFLVIDGSGNSSICDKLNDNVEECSGPTMSVDWSTGNSAPPVDLVARGDSRVSAQPVSLDGTAKGDIFFVGI